MEIDITQKAIKVKLRKLFLTIIFAALLLMIYVGGFVEPLTGINKNYIAFIVVLIYILIFLYFHLLDLNYIYYTDENGKIILRYYSLRSISKGYRSIEIPKREFVKFETQKTFFNLKEHLILFQRLKKGVAKYPPVSISALNHEERSQLKKSLTDVLNANKQ
jgi:hypothetical protein